MNSTTHDAPLVELVQRLDHLRGSTLRERVVRLRWKRRRSTTIPAVNGGIKGCQQTASAGSVREVEAGSPGNGTDLAEPVTTSESEQDDQPDDTTT